MNKKPNIIVAGILDTKGQEIKFLADRVKAAGGEPTVLELSVGSEVGWADIGVGTILKEIERNKDDVFSLDRGKASDIIVEGATVALWVPAWPPALCSHCRWASLNSCSPQWLQGMSALMWEPRTSA